MPDQSAEPFAKDGLAWTSDQIYATAVSVVIRVGVGNNGPVNRLPGVNVEIARGTIQTLLGQGNQFFFPHARIPSYLLIPIDIGSVPADRRVPHP